jgi:hypothetical protein
MKAARYCIAAFLDVSQAFDNVWHQGQFHKIKNSFPTDLYAIIRSYLLHRTFRVKHRKAGTQLKEINSGMLHSRVLRPVLYLLFTADLPIALDSATATHADDIAVLVAHNNHLEASLRLEEISITFKDG